MKKLIIFISVLIFALSCSKNQSKDLPQHIKKLENLTVYSADEEREYQVQLEREQVFGDTDDALIGRLVDIAVDKIGRVYLADGKQSNIKVYDQNGNFLSRLGRPGKGPGEFRNLIDVQTSKNRLFAHDGNQERSLVFSVDSLTYDHGFIIANNRDEFDELGDAYTGNYYVKNDGAFLLKFYKSHHPKDLKEWDRVKRTAHYYFIDEDGRIISEKLFETTSSIRVVVPVGGYSVDRRTGMLSKSLTALSDDGHIYQAWSEDFLVKVYGPEGKYQRAFYYPYERVSLTRESASAAEIPEFILKGFQKMDLPETWPALNDMLIDDQNRIWLSTIIEDEQVYQWWVLDAKDGQLLSRFEWPRDKQIEEIKNAKLYARETDQSGVARIVRYDIEMNSGS